MVEEDDQEPNQSRGHLVSVTTGITTKNPESALIKIPFFEITENKL